MYNPVGGSLHRHVHNSSRQRQEVTHKFLLQSSRDFSLQLTNTAVGSCHLLWIFCQSLSCCSDLRFYSCAFITSRSMMLSSSREVGWLLLSFRQAKWHKTWFFLPGLLFLNCLVNQIKLSETDIWWLILFSSLTGVFSNKDQPLELLNPLALNHFGRTSV